jgi:hypothetical protein
MFLSEWREVPSAPCLAGKKKLDSSRLDVVEIARVLTCFRACFLPDLAKDLSAPQYCSCTLQADHNI